MENSTAKKIPAYLLLVLLLYMSCDAQDMRYCCKQKTCPCRLYDLLRGSGNHAAGILTLGKRKSEDQRFQSRLYQLLHASKNQAAGILTMGKRMEPNHSLYTHSTPSLTPHSRPDLKSCRPISAVESETKNVDRACCGPLSKLCLTRCTCST